VTITVGDRAGTVSAHTIVKVKASVTFEQIAPPPPPPPSSNPTVTVDVYTVGSNFAYVTVATADASEVYYYYAEKGSLSEAPAAYERYFDSPL